MGTSATCNAQWDRLKAKLPGSAHKDFQMPELTHAYVSGPMRKRPYFNRANFDRVTANVRAQGFIAFNPHEKDRDMHGEDYGMDNHTGAEDKTFDLRAALKIDMDWICDEANFMVMLDGWEESSGSTAERALAVAIGMPILSEHDFELDWAGAVAPSVLAGRADAGVGIYAPMKSTEFNETMAYIAERRREAGVKPGEPLVGLNLPTSPVLRVADKMSVDRSVLTERRAFSEHIDAPLEREVGRHPALTPHFEAIGGPSGSQEIRVVDPVTGGEKGSKPAQLGALDPHAIMEVAKVAGFGAKKYERFNYAKGYAWSLSYDAMQRHLHAWWGREDTDPESGLSHLAHAAWHCLALLTFHRFGKGTDDRFPLSLD